MFSITLWDWVITVTFSYPWIWMVILLDVVFTIIAWRKDIWLTGWFVSLTIWSILFTLLTLTRFTVTSLS